MYINTSLAFGDNNIVELRFEGFKEKFKDFISEIWKRIKSFIPKEEFFEVCQYAFSFPKSHNLPFSVFNFVYVYITEYHG